TDADGAPWVGVVVMSSKDVPNRNEGPYQCRYYAWKIDAINGPQRMVDGKLLTNNRGNRPCNHPDLQYAGGTDMLFLFGTNDDNNASVQPYAQVLDAMTGNPKGERRNLGDNNGNDGAGTATMLRVGDSLESLQLPTTYPKRFVYCYNDNGNNADCTVAEIQAGGSVNLVDRINNVIDPANIPRPFMSQITPDGKFVVMAAKGDNRPPEDGAYARVIDVVNTNAGNGGKLTRQQAVMMSNQGNRMYANSPEIVAVGPTPGTFWAMNTASKDNGNNKKGTSFLYTHVVRFTPDYEIEILATAPAGHYQTHAAMCASTHGPDGVQAAIVVEASVSNSGPGVVTPYYYNEAEMKITEGPTKVTTPYTADSGELANLYGNNPNTQGRDFVSCIGDVPNPGYGIEGGWMSDVKSFIVTSTYGMMTENDYKNSMFLTFVPAHTPGTELPPDTPPDPIDDGSGSGGDDVDDGDGSDDTDDGSTEQPKTGGAGGCAAGGTSGLASGLLVLLGAFLLVNRRRR
ncbi:MAG TPA: hypothetical protein VK028_10925, partial [Micromonosporaceae bacterium]|nr:hypothetical protein [Micromonosporaceae bacterium]